MRIRNTIRLAGLVVILASPWADQGRAGMVENIAFNPTRTGFPHPLDSDGGWGGGQDKWEIVDGYRTYPGEWARGLAFTGGDHNWGGEPAGPRQVTINFGHAVAFNEVVIWHHGNDNIPVEAALEYWDGLNWIDIEYARDVVASPDTSWSQPDRYIFEDTTGSKLRWAFDNSGINILGTPILHGWIYEFEVMAVPEPATVSLLVLSGLALTRRRRKPSLHKKVA